MKDQKSLVIAIIGQPNAGKSSLVNAIVGEKISIVTHKVQTTRFNIRGIYNKDKTQLVFIDTPGIFDPQKPLEKAIVKNAISSIGEADLICLLVDAKKFSKLGLDEGILKHLRYIKKPLYVALNKIDLLGTKENALPLLTQLNNLNLFKEIFLLSATKGEGVEHFISFLSSQTVNKPWLYIDDEITDQPVRKLCEEITREQAFILLHKEIPYSLKVETEKWEESAQEIKIHQSIFVTKVSQKAILLGEKGNKIKEIGSRARYEMSKFLGKKIHLFLFIKVRENWIEKDLS